MRRIATLCAAVPLVVVASSAAAQTPARAPATGTSTTNANNVTTGSNRNTNANSNSQFLSGNNTGVNNGALEVYAGADPYQGLYIGGSTNLPQLPGIPSAPSNFSQPYKPEMFVNTPPFLPTEITQAEAKRCRDAKVSWYGGSREEDGDAASMKLFYAGKQEPPVAASMTTYVGTAMATTADGPFIAALCEAAYRAMRKGATVGVVEFNIRPKNTMFGVGFGASGGATGLPAAGANPYAIAGTLGFGTGWSNQRVEGEVVLQLTGLRPSATAATDSGAVSASVSAVTPAPRSDSAGARPEAGANEPGPVRPQQGDGASRPSESTIVPRAGENAKVVPGREGASLIAGVTKVATVGEPDATSASSAVRQPRKMTVYYPLTRLTDVRKGQAKELVFSVFGTVFVEREGSIAEMQGMRLVASDQAATNMRFEVAEVRLADDHERHASYWFLFEKGRLLTWGRPEDWPATVAKYRLDLRYRPDLRVEAKVEP